MNSTFFFSLSFSKPKQCKMYECYLNFGSRCNSHQNNAVIIRFDVGQLFSIHTTGEWRVRNMGRSGEKAGDDAT